VPRKDFSIVRDMFARNSGLPFCRRHSPDQVFIAHGRSALKNSGNGSQRDLVPPVADNLLRGTMVECAKRHATLPREISVEGAMHAVESFTPA
jgi:hypothetical protein